MPGLLRLVAAGVEPGTCRHRRDRDFAKLLGPDVQGALKLIVEPSRLEMIGSRKRPQADGGIATVRTIQPQICSGTSTPGRRWPIASRARPTRCSRGRPAARRHDIEKGYEYAKDQFVVISDEDLERAKVQLYSEQDGRRVEATTACREFIEHLRSLVDAMKLHQTNP